MGHVTVGERVRVLPDDLRVGDVLPDPHFSGRGGIVTKVVSTWYGCSVYYQHDGSTCVSAVFDEEWAGMQAGQYIHAGIEVQR